jgi:hypothetical protein
LAFLDLVSTAELSVLQHYETTQAFIRSLELLAPSLDAVVSLRSHESYAIFEKKWQLPVYFQLRWKEIVGNLEESLARPRPDIAYSKGLLPEAFLVRTAE